MTINYDEFKKVELKVGQILSAERIEGSDKLLKLSVNLGEENPRQIIAGIGKAYAPEDIVDTQAIFVANLEPRALMGLESQGMIVAGRDSEEKPVLVRPLQELTPGTELS